jgi:hypothetical protein
MATITVTTATANATDAQGTPFSHQTGTDTYNGATIRNNIYTGTYGNGINPDATTNLVITNNTVLFDISTAGAPPGSATSSNTVANGDTSVPAGTENLSRNMTNMLGGLYSSGTPTCTPPVSCPASNHTVTIVSSAMSSYYALVVPNFGALAWTSRANAISNVTPSTTAWSSSTSPGGLLSDGSYLGAVWPPDINNHVCWATAAVFNAATDCTTVSALAQ